MFKCISNGSSVLQFKFVLRGKGHGFDWTINTARKDKSHCCWSWLQYLSNCDQIHSKDRFTELHGTLFGPFFSITLHFVTLLINIAVVSRNKHWSGFCMHWSRKMCNYISRVSSIIISFKMYIALTKRSLDQEVWVQASMSLHGLLKE